MYIKRELQSAIVELFESPFVTAILGPHRVGKSTLVDHYVSIHSERKWVVITMDKRALRQKYRGYLSATMLYKEILVVQ